MHTASFLSSKQAYQPSKNHKSDLRRPPSLARSPNLQSSHNRNGGINLIHKRGTKICSPTGGPSPCFGQHTNKIFAKVIANRLSSQLSKQIRKEQKGFVKGRFILETIITLCKGFANAEETNKDYLFFKIDFEKALDILEWDFILQALEDIPKFVSMIATLFENSRSRVLVNGIFTEPFTLRRSIR